jgi:peptidyl-prolyl cis-trans isomerase D
MAVIQKIRSKYAKLAGFIIALSLVGFILMDAASGRFGDMFGRDSSVAKVDGEKIDSREFSQRVKDYETLYAYSQGKTNIDEASRAQINEQSLKDLVNERLIAKVCEKVGIQSTKEEEKEIIYGSNPDQIVAQFPYFQNRETKMFDPQYIKAFEKQADQMDPTGKVREQWETLKAYVIRTNFTRKYTAAITKNIYVPRFINEFQLNERRNIASIRYVKIPYSTIPDAQVIVKDEEMNEYMKKHEKQYQADENSRSIEYVSFDITPSPEDTLRALGMLEKIKSDFANAADAESFVNKNSDEPYSGAFVNKKSFMSAYSDSILKMPAGSVFGPYFENNTYKLTKVLEKKEMPDSVKCRHILVKTKQNGQETAPDSVAKKKIDSAIAAINGGADFNAMVQKYSEDDGSKNTGGEYTFTLQQKPGISKEFGDFIFEGKPGEKKLVKVDNGSYSGYHYIEILEQKGIQPSAKLATISKALYAGDNTVNAAFGKANEFAGKYGTDKAFDEAIKKNNLNKRMAENIKAADFNIPGIGPSREIVRWVYDAKVGEVSTVFQLEGRYIIAKLTGVQEKGLMKLNPNIRPAIEAAVRTEKKAEMIKTKYKTMTSVDAVAAAATQQVQKIDSFNASLQFIENLGYEPKVAGYSFYEGFKVNATSPAIKGQDGVFYVNLTNRTKVEVAVNPAIENQKASMAEQQIKNNLQYQATEMIRKNASIKYNPKNL